MNSKAPVIEQETVLNSFPSVSGLRKLYYKWSEFPFAVVQKRILLMDSSSTFRKMEAIFLRAVLKPLINNFSLHHAYVALSPSY